MWILVLICMLRWGRGLDFGSFIRSIWSDFWSSVGLLCDLLVLPLYLILRSH